MAIGFSGFVSHILSDRGIGALITIKLNPGISKSGVEPRIDTCYRECGPSTAQFYLRELESENLIENKPDGDISHLFLTDKGERFLDRVVQIYCEFSTYYPSADEVWRACENANGQARKWR